MNQEGTVSRGAAVLRTACFFVLTARQVRIQNFPSLSFVVFECVTTLPAFRTARSASFTAASVGNDSDRSGSRSTRFSSQDSALSFETTFTNGCVIASSVRNEVIARIAYRKRLPAAAACAAPGGCRRRRAGPGLRQRY